MTSITITSYPIRHRLAGLIATLFCLASAIPAHAALEIPETPLQTSVSADPNVMMIFDDSGSMASEVMPEDLIISRGYTVSVLYLFPRTSNNIYGFGSSFDNYIATVDDKAPYNALTRSPQVNTIYYNPSITYLPWSKSDGSLYPAAVPNCAWHNPMQTTNNTTAYCRNLTITNNFSGSLTGSTRYWHTCPTSGNCARSNTDKNFWPATYFWKNSVSSNTWLWDSYAKVEIRSSTPTYSGHGREKRTDCAGGVCSYAQEIQNFANWYTYYRSRALTARAGVGRAFAAQDTGLRVGFGAIGKGTGTIDGKDTEIIVSGVRKFENASRDQFFSDLYNKSLTTAGTPLQKALDKTGIYYSRTDDKGPWSTTPGQSGGSDLACRQSYAILMTDGYYNGDPVTVGNSDNTSGSPITGPNGQSYTYAPVSPFRDSYSNTLADIAMKYWKTDLRDGSDGITNSVPTNAKDPAFWQHMTTFTVGLGVKGSIDPDTAFNAIASGATITWPNPTSSDSNKIDDLLHAAVNGHGKFFSAQNPTEFATALTAMLKEIVERKSSSSSVAVTGTRLTSNTRVFSPSFNTTGWVGELSAFNLTPTGISATPAWKASEGISAVDRKIFTMTGGNKRAFTWSNLSSTDQAAIGSATILDYLRGNQSQETSKGGTLRTRDSLLGDIVHSSPVYHQAGQTVYVGANDGMLHAFNAETGVERFAYIPSPLLGKLKHLSETSYQHTYYVDGELTLVDMADSGLEKTYLVGTMGAGGKGLFALDVSDPASFAADNIAWEYVIDPAHEDGELGHMMGKPIYARLSNGAHAVIVGNGYNSASGKAALYVIDLATGALITKLVVDSETDNGMATPGIVDANGDGYIDFVYAGDLRGNVWKFNASGWSVSKFFTARDAAGNPQPITTQITSAVNYLNFDPHAGKRYIFFGTGSYFLADDLNDKSVQSWYALIDRPTSIAGRGDLRQREFKVNTMTADGMPARVFKGKDDYSMAPGTSDMSGKRGWYLDWKDTGERGERVITPSVMYRLNEPTLLGSSVIPEASDPCQPGGTGFVNAINAFTGLSLKESLFIFANATSNVVGSIDLGIGMPSQPFLVVDENGVGQLVVGGSGAGSGDIAPRIQPIIDLDFGGPIYWREISK